MVVAAGRNPLNVMFILQNMCCPLAPRGNVRQGRFLAGSLDAEMDCKQSLLKPLNDEQSGVGVGETLSTSATRVVSQENTIKNISKIWSTYCVAWTCVDDCSDHCR